MACMDLQGPKFRVDIITTGVKLMEVARERVFQFKLELCSFKTCTLGLTISFKATTTKKNF